MIVRPSLQVPMTLGQIPALAAMRFGDKRAVASPDGILSFNELDRLSARLAQGLIHAGIRKGDRVTLCGPNSWRWMVTYYAVARAGAVVNPVNAMVTHEELEYIVRNCGAQALVSTAEKIEGWLRNVGLTLPVIAALDGNGFASAPPIDSLLAADLDPAFDTDISRDGLSTICYTSGTTGHPKGAMLSHRAVVTNSAMTAQMHGRNPSDITLTALPLSHVYGNVVMNASVLTGGTLVLQPRFEVEPFLQTLQRERATVIDGVPTMYMYLLASPTLPATNTTSLRCAFVGGQSMPEAKMLEVEERIGCPLVELWGMTEIAGLGSTHPHLGERVHGSIGIALPYSELRVAKLENCSEDAADLEIGELMVRGVTTMSGYFDNPQATRETIEPDGWLHTGDLARRDENGRFYIVDRKKDMIITGGYNIYPAELERVIAAHRAVAMVAVGRLPDEMKGEVAKAYIVLKPGMEATDADVLAHCRKHLAAYKVPRLVQFVPDLPKTSTGKILRRELKTLETAKS
ncbi:MAG: class I adenylate-forming enzyme family protein [Bradyrhizobium sp.]|uniref:class I adenylate-forming enzyme family protein n=1 Tax=Bradyrhizobium sp. TaxID=376 RepID=UPI003D0AF1C1